MSSWLATEPLDRSRSVQLLPLGDGITELAMRDSDGRNGMSPAWVAGFQWALDQLAADQTCKVVLLSGLEEYFCTGATREALADLASGRLAPTELVLGRRLMGLPMPVVAAAEGHAIGGGLALMMSADLMVIAEESRYGANFMSLGITPGMGTTTLLAATLGSALSHEMLFTGDLYRGRTLARSSAFNAVLPRAEVRARAMQLARALAEKPRANLIRLKRVLTLPRRRAFEESSTLESLMHELSLDELDLDQWGAP